MAGCHSSRSGSRAAGSLGRVLDHNGWAADAEVGRAAFGGRAIPGQVGLVELGTPCVNVVADGEAAAAVAAPVGAAPVAGVDTAPAVVTFEFLSITVPASRSYR